MNSIPPEIVLNILSFIDCLKLNDVQLVCHQFRLLIPYVHNDHQCLFSNWFRVSKLIESKFKKSKKLDKTYISFLFLPQYGFTLMVSQIDNHHHSKSLYLIEISDYLDRKFIVQFIQAGEGFHPRVEYDIYLNIYSVKMVSDQHHGFKINFVIDLTTLDNTFWKQKSLIWLNEINNYSESFHKFSCDFQSSKPIQLQWIKLSNYPYELYAKPYTQVVTNEVIISPDNKWYVNVLAQGLLRGILHIYHFNNYPDLWLVVSKISVNYHSYLSLLKLNEKAEIVIIKEIPYHTHLVCPVYCPLSKTIFLLSDFKNGMIKLHHF